MLIPNLRCPGNDGTDGQTTYCSITAFCVASRGKNTYTFVMIVKRGTASSIRTQRRPDNSTSMLMNSVNNSSGLRHTTAE